MKRIIALIFLLSLGPATLVFPQEKVTIPKARLEELERKEAELEKLKGTAGKTPSLVDGPEQKSESRESNSAVPEAKRTEPAVSANSVKTEAASIQLLPSIEKDDVVSATDLAAQYRADATAADKRYRKHTFKVRGEIVGFEKPPLIRNYNILLKTPEPQIRIICDFYPAEKFRGVYTINGGTTLVGTLPDTRVPIAKVGDHVTIEGRCKGMSGGGVKMTDCEVKER